MPDISNDDLIREIMEMREKGRHEEASRFYQAERKWKIEMAKELYKDGYPIEKLAAMLKISVEELEKLLKE